MACNDGPDKANNLHTDLEHGLHKRVWNATVDEITNTVSFTCKLADGELGLPGNRTFTVAYVLQAGPTGAAELTCTQSCVTDADTFVNMTNHTYFNLAGHDAGTVLDQVATIDAEAFLPSARTTSLLARFAPWSARHSISAHPRRSAATSRRTTSSSRLHGALTIVSAWMALPPTPTRATHCACKIQLAPHARHLRNHTGAHLYTGNWLSDNDAKDGCSYGPRDGVAFEPEFWPDNNHHTDWRIPSARLTTRLARRSSTDSRRFVNPPSSRCKGAAL